MRKIYLIILIFISFAIKAQVGISTTSPNSAAELTVVSPNNNTGVLIPTMTTAQMNAIDSPTHGLLIYNTDLNKFMYNAGTPAAKLWTFVGEVPKVSTTAGLTTVAGDIRYNTSDNHIYFYDGSSWRQIQEVAGP